jgi:hypothetical protein
VIVDVLELWAEHDMTVHTAEESDKALARLAVGEDIEGVSGSSLKA